MASDNSSRTPGAGDGDAPALALEVKALRGLLEELQAELKPAVQSSLRERSSELQRVGADLAEQQAEIERLKGALAAAEVRSQQLQDEASRWREAAHRGLDEIAARAREAAARFEAETAELNQSLTSLKAQLDASRTEARALMQARDAARQEAARRQERIRSLEARVLDRKRLLRRINPLYWPQGLLRALARLRRRLFRR